MLVEPSLSNTKEKILGRVFLPVRIMVGIRVRSSGAVVTGAVVIALLSWLQHAIIRKMKCHCSLSGLSGKNSEDLPGCYCQSSCKSSCLAY
jgi:hypothetical protein